MKESIEDLEERLSDALLADLRAGALVRQLEAELGERLRAEKLKEQG